MKVSLIYPPTVDPTSPYISVPVLTAYLREHGVEVVPIDANLEAYEYLLQPETLCGFARLAENAVQRENEIWERLVYRERVVSPERYRELAEALPAFTIGKISGDARCRRSPRQFRGSKWQATRIC